MHDKFSEKLFIVKILVQEEFACSHYLLQAVEAHSAEGVEMKIAIM